MGSSLTVPFRPSDISTGLVGYWKFNNDATDSSGNSNNLSNGTTYPTYAVTDYWKSGEYSADFEKDSTQYLTIASGSQTGLNMYQKSFTVVYWVKPETVTGGYIVKRGAVNTEYITFINGDAKPEWQIEDQSTASTTALSAGKWYHLAYVFNYATSVASIYINGNLDTSATNSGVVPDSAVAFTISDGTTAYDGLLKDVAVWNVALTPLQIKSLALGVDLSKYAYRPNNVSVQPTHWWKLNEVSGTRADSAATGGITLSDSGTTLSSGGYIEGVSAKFVTASSQYLTAADSADFNFGTGNFSIFSRVYFSTDPDGLEQCFYSQHADDAHRLSFRQSATNLNFLISGGTGDIQGTGAYNFTAGVWYAVVLRRSGNDFTMWVDGIQVGATVTDTDSVPDIGADVDFGRRKAGTDHLNGQMEDMAVWKGYALTDAEIKSLACALPIQRQGIVSYWKMDEESGTRADSIGANTLADNNSVLYGTGKVGNASDFEAGNTEYLSKTDASQTGLDIVTDLSLIAWVKLESNEYGDVISKAPVASNTGYDLYIGGTQYPTLQIHDETSASATAIVAGTFAHVVGLWDGANRKVYVDAVQTKTDASTTAPSDNAVDFNIGARNSSNGHYDGLVDEAIVAKRYFRPEEIKAVYLKGLNGKEVTSSERSPATGSFLSFLIL